MNNEIFVRNVEIRCKQKGVPPTVACRESGAGKDFLTNLKKGQSPSLGKAQQLAQYLGCTVSDLLGENPQAIVSESGTLSTAELRLLSAYRTAPAPIRAIVDTALEPYKR